MAVSLHEQLLNASDGYMPVHTRTLHKDYRSKNKIQSYTKSCVKKHNSSSKSLPYEIHFHCHMMKSILSGADLRAD